MIYFRHDGITITSCRFSFIFFKRVFILLLNVISIMYLFHMRIKFRVVCCILRHCCCMHAVHVHYTYAFSPCENKTNILDERRCNATRYEAKLMSYNHTDITTARIDFGSYMQLNNRTKYNVLGN